MPNRSDALSRARALESVVREVSREAILPRYLNASREKKDDGSTLTYADLAAQRALIERLPDLIEAPVIGEEMSPAQQSECWQAGQEGVWCIDPIDGTTNFANGIPSFAISVAYMVAGESQFGVVYNPITDESFYAAREQGAWLGGKRLPLRPGAARLADAVAGIDFKRLRPTLAAALVTHPPYYSQRNFGSSALEWCFVATGRLDVYLHGGQAMWDYAAGQLILAEAGGSFSTLDGEALCPDPIHKRAVVVAANRALHAEWLGWLRAHDPRED